MPEIEVRPAIATDLPYLMAIDHRYRTEYVWQMDLQIDPAEINLKFRKTRLPRAVRHDYPRNHERLADEWTHRSGLLVALHDGKPMGYISLMVGVIPDTTLVTDLAVVLHLRRQGIGTAMVRASILWGKKLGLRRLMVTLQTKNYPGIHFCEKHGYVFSGFNDHYYPNGDIALFFTLRI